MYVKAIMYIVCLLLVTMVDISLVDALPFDLDRLRLTVLALVFLALFASPVASLWWVVGAGLIFETFSFTPFGLHFAALTVAAVCAYILFARLVTNRSVYAIGLAAMAAVASYDAVFWLYEYFFQVAPGTPFLASVVAELKALCYNGLAGAVIFYIATIGSKRFLPVFLPSRRIR